jgi:hypothetical protein
VNNAVEGQYILDLSLPPPSVAGIVPDPDPKNLSLRTTSGHINAEIWIIHDGSGEPKKVSLDLRTDGGAIRAKLVRSVSLDSSVDLCFEENVA